MIVDSIEGCFSFRQPDVVFLSGIKVDGRDKRIYSTVPLGADLLCRPGSCGNRSRDIQGRCRCRNRRRSRRTSRFV